MKLKNTSATQDGLVNDCVDFGGKAAELAEVVEELDGRLTEALEKIEQFEKEQQ